MPIIGKKICLVSNSMDKKLLFIAISSILTLVLLVFFVLVSWDYFVDRETTPLTIQGKCGDGICDEIEKEKGICPQDCEKIKY